MNNNKPETIIYNLSEVNLVAAKLLSLLPRCSVLTFSGPLGAGKTTLIRELLRKVGVVEPITSPTFTYLNIYTNAQENKFYHFDLYRISSIDAFCQAGFDEYLYQPNSWALVEWPEHIMPLLDHSVCHVTIDYHNQSCRELTLQCR